MNRPTPTGRRSQGFTLIEVLISVLVLGVGLLGFALMQTRTLGFAQSSNHRSIAVNLAYEMIDTMRANRLLASQYPGLVVGESTDPTCPAGVNMTPMENVVRWKCQLGAALPGGNGDISLENGVVTVTVTWLDARWQDGGDQDGVVTIRSNL